MNPHAAKSTSCEGSGFEHVEAIRELARFRYSLRKFVRFSENAARAFDVTPQQHQLMLGVAGFTDRNCATISELAEFLQERNHSVVGLVERAVQSGLVRRAQHAEDRRVVVVSLTRRGEQILSRLTRLHYEEVTRLSMIRIPGGARRPGSMPKPKSAGGPGSARGTQSSLEKD